MLEQLPFEFTKEDLKQKEIFKIFKESIKIMLKRIEMAHSKIKFPNEDICLVYKIAEKWWDEMDPLKM